MNIERYKLLISSLPVRQQSFTTKRRTWLKAESSIEWLREFNNELFNNEESLNISRRDIFDTNGSTREFILKTIYWGYPRGMRGNHFVNILLNIEILETTFKDLKSKANPTSKDFKELTQIIKGISGLHLSTYSKLLYFLGIKFNNNPCLILDQRLIDVFASEFYGEFSSLSRINYSNGESKYLDYLDITNKLSLDLQTQGENIEQFLFIFGNNLKMAESHEDESLKYSKGLSVQERLQYMTQLTRKAYGKRYDEALLKRNTEEKKVVFMSANEGESLKDFFIRVDNYKKEQDHKLSSK
ncbi:MAG TPA: hypothetical protein VNW99_03740 [Cytophagaceae bacterium]|jgi:hypothetical protein|nr:hypothetical protein [Cytophagaceae bacterium]